MTVLQYDPTNWLLAATRSLGSYVDSKINDGDSAPVDVEMSWPDTSEWTKDSPLAKSLIHFEQDALANRVFGFGQPGFDVYTEPVTYPTDPRTARVDELGWHEINFDVGVWCSPESGGVTERMRLTQLLVNLFTVAGAKVQLQEETGGLWVVGFSGGRNEVDRINDLPVYRALDMTLIVRVFSKHTGEEIVVPDNIETVQDLTIADDTGAQVAI